MRRRDLVTQWRRDLARLEDAHEGAMDGSTVLAPVEVARLEGMIAVYQRMLADVA